MKRLALAAGFLVLGSTSARANITPAKIDVANRTMAKQQLLERAGNLQLAPTPTLRTTVAPNHGLESVQTESPSSLKRRKQLAIEAVRNEIGPRATGPNPTVDVFVGAIDEAQEPALHEFTKSGLITVYTKKLVDPKANFIRRLAAKFSRENKVAAVEVDSSAGTVFVHDQSRRAPQYKAMSFIKEYLPLQLFRDLRNNEAEMAQFKSNATLLAGSLTAGALHFNPMVVGSAMTWFGTVAVDAVKKARAEEDSVRTAAFNFAFKQAKALRKDGRAVGIADVKMLYEDQLKGTGTVSEAFGAFYNRLRLKEVSDSVSNLVQASNTVL